MRVPADVIPLPPPEPVTAGGRAPWLGGFPVISTLILLTIALVAVFSDQLAPHNPEIGSLAARFKPPSWESGGTHKYLSRTHQSTRICAPRPAFGARRS